MSRLSLFFFSLGLAAAAPQPARDSYGFPTGTRRNHDGFPTAPRQEDRAIGSATTAHLLTGPSGFQVDIKFDESNVDNFLVKREAIGPSGNSFKRPAAESLEVDEMSNDQSILGNSETLGPTGYKKSAAESLVVDESNTDHSILGKSEALGPSGYKRPAAESLVVDESSTNHIILGKREAIGPTSYKRSAAISLEFDESNSDHIILGKSEAPGYLDKRASAGPTASRHRTAPTSIEAE